MDHGHLRRLPRILLLRQTIHPPLLPARLPAASEAPIRHLLPHNILHHLLLGRLLHRHRPLQRAEPRMEHLNDNELFLLRQTHVRNRGSRSNRRCAHTRFPDPDGVEAAYFPATEDILAVCLPSRFDVSVPGHLLPDSDVCASNTYQSLTSLRDPSSFRRAITRNDRCHLHPIPPRDTIVRCSLSLSLPTQTSLHHASLLPSLPICLTAASSTTSPSSPPACPPSAHFSNGCGRIIGSTSLLSPSP